MKSDKPTTKKFPGSLGTGGLPTSKSEFLIPAIDPTSKNTFIGLKSQKEFKLGAISYKGREIDSEKVLSKMHFHPGDRNRIKGLLDKYISELLR